LREDLTEVTDQLFDTEIDTEGKSVTASFLGMQEQRAIFREGLGCTLLAGASDAGRIETKGAVGLLAMEVIMKRFLFPLIFLLALTFACSLPFPAEDETIEDTPLVSTPAEVSAEAHHPGFIRRDRDKLVVGEDAHEIRLRGVNFNNLNWEEDAALIINSDHHSELDFQRVADMGMNVIRFNLSYVVFEDDDDPYNYKREGWDWLDQNISWAKEYGIYLLINIHVPQGGYQGGTDEGFALWDNAENQERLKALWREIAARYKDEPLIAGYDLLNEPTPSQSAEQWEILTQELIDEIRTVDKNHLIVVAQAMNAFGEDYALFMVEDDNVMYDFHFYYPGEYTDQYAYFSGRGDGGSYPNPDVSVLSLEFVFADAIENPRAPLGDSDWSFFEGNLYRVTDERIISGTPTWICDVNQGSVLFDDFVVYEYDENQDFVRQIIFVDIEYAEDPEAMFDGIDPFVSATGWWIPWSADGGGSHAVIDDAHLGNHSLAITGVTSGYTLGSPNLMFAVQQNHHYQISGWMKGIGVTDESCQMSIEFAQIPPGEEFVPFDRNYLESQMHALTEFGRTNNVPMNVGEFGLTRWAFENNKGGQIWVTDMLELFDRYEASFQYWDYHADNFAIYPNPKGLPDPAAANRRLIELFTEFFSVGKEFPF